jgi:prepilin-type N-terminal cleavage/methylation domain-containing protein/prepilin-type processing-associated H-X9-DG protein
VYFLGVLLMKKNLQKGFTLVELLVIIAIVGILAAALITNMTSGLEAGRSLKCKANLKNLAQAVSGFSVTQYGDDNVGLPTAGSFEYSRYNDASDNEGEPFIYLSSSAWVSWVPNDFKWSYPNTASQKPKMLTSVFYDTNASNKDSPAFYSITNGVLWSRVGKDASLYVCETHKRVMEPQLRARIYRSYVMNRYFGFENDNYRRGVHLGSINQSGSAAICVLLTELPGQAVKIKTPANELEKDSVLDPDNNESFGFNHKVGNKWAANVVFADGHVEGVIEPTGASSIELKDLTTQMCNGTEIDAKLRVKMQ